LEEEVSEPPEYDLRDVEAQFISFVPRGANKKQFLVVKEMKEDIIKTILETPDEDLAKFLKEAGLEGEGAEALVGASKLLKAYKDALPENALALLAKCTGLDVPESGKEVVPGQAGEEDEDQPTGELTKEKLEKLDPGLRDLIQKSMDESRIAKERAEAAENVAKELKEEKVLKEYVARAGELQHLPIQPLKFGPVLKTLGEDHPAEFEEIYRVLKAADAALAKSELFKEIGKAGSSETSAEASVYAKARSLVAKDGSLTLEGAVNKVLEDDPELYEKYEDERQEAVRKRSGK
jgi:Asp-tRNA(Asn)/Glu-tRNA(Gln) amidotransferase B subunit